MSYQVYKNGIIDAALTAAFVAALPYIQALCAAINPQPVAFDPDNAGAGAVFSNNNTTLTVPYLGGYVPEGEEAPSSPSTHARTLTGRTAGKFAVGFTGTYDNQSDYGELFAGLCTADADMHSGDRPESLDSGSVSGCYFSGTKVSNGAQQAGYIFDPVGTYPPVGIPSGSGEMVMLVAIADGEASVWLQNSRDVNDDAEAGINPDLTLSFEGAVYIMASLMAGNYPNGNSALTINGSFGVGTFVPANLQPYNEG